MPAGISTLAILTALACDGGIDEPALSLNTPDPEPSQPHAADGGANGNLPMADAGVQRSDAARDASAATVDTGVPETSVQPTTIQGDCVEGINRYRRTKGLPDLLRWTTAEVCVDREASADSLTNTPHSAFGMCSEIAQNECPGWPGPLDKALIDDCLRVMWAEGPGGGHYDNMTNPFYKRVSCGFSTTAAGDVWATQDFAP
jgi:hypothetical protein